MKKQLAGVFLTITLLCSMLPNAFAQNAVQENTAWKTIYVSPSGSDEGNGSESSPFATLERAQEEVRKYNSDMQGNIVVNLMPGRYEIMTNLDFGLEDSGTNGYDVIWQSVDENNLATISGAKEVKGTWQEGENGIWSVKADDLKFVRELFVNDKIATRARSSKKIYGGAYYDVAEKWTHPHLGQKDVKKLGFYVDKSMLGLYENPEDIEFHWISQFRTALFHVDDIIEDPNNDNQVIAVMDREYWNEYYTYFAHAKATPQITPARGFIVENAYELLDEPGEFYFNKKTKVLSYIPREGEDLNTAEILVPQGEQLMYVHGGNYYNRIHNIQFKNIRFAHTTSFEQEESNIAGGQAEYHYANNTPWIMGRASNLVDWAEEVDFEACVFYGLSTMALHLRNGVYNSNVEGNVFADTGATALCVGGNSHYYVEEPKPNENGLEDAAWRASWSTSYHYWPGTGYTYQALNIQRSQEFSRAPGSGWYSEPWAKEEGTCPWVMIELESAYDIDNFEFSFPENSTDEQRSNFEVLVSNDRDFKDYTTLKTYTSAAQLKEKIEVEGTEKFRYIMLRKTVPGDFCLNGVWAWTSERMAQGEKGAPEYCNITNNIFKRVALQKQGSYPIWINYTKGFDVSHNHIEDAPYAGITIGWGWYAANSTARDNKVNYNRINDVMLYMNDGAGIYVLGQQYGTEVNGNYISNTVLNGMGLYYDQGSAGVSARDNVTVGTTSYFNLNSNAQLNTNYVTNSIRDSYHVGGSYFYAFGFEAAQQVDPNGISNIKYSIYETPMDMELPNTFGLDTPPEEATRIMAEAGLEDEWTWIENRVPAGDDSQRTILYGIDSSDSVTPLSTTMKSNTRIDADISNAEALLKQGTFGDLPWQYSPETKIEVEYWLDQVNRDSSRVDDFNKGHLEEQYALQAAIRAANDSVYHPSYEEMLTLCEELASNKDNFKSADLKEFNETVEAIKKTSPKGRGDKAVAANKLERAYELLDSRGKESRITGAVIRGAVTTIDAENKKVTIELPNDMDYSMAKPYITVSTGSRLAIDASNIDCSKITVELPLYNEYFGKYSSWNLELIKKVEGDKTVILPEPAKWIYGNTNVKRTNVGGAMTVEPWFTPTMYNEVAEGNIKLSINVPRADTKDGINLIFCSQTKDLQPTTLESKNTYYMMKIVDNTMTLYKVHGGKATAHLSVNDIYFDYGSYNDIEISVTEEHKLNRVSIKLNGELLVDTLIADPIGNGGYFGILSKNMAVKVK